MAEWCPHSLGDPFPVNSLIFTEPQMGTSKPAAFLSRNSSPLSPKKATMVATLVLVPVYSMLISRAAILYDAFHGSTPREARHTSTA